MAHFQTSEKIKIDYELASVPSRILAFLIDAIIQYALFIILYLFFIIMMTGSIVIDSGLNDESFGAFSAVSIVILTLSFLFIIFYRLIFETIWKGQTPGKRILKIRIINDNGTYISFLQVLLRNIFLIIDALPTGFLTGLITMFINKKNKRIGDLVAGTIVIKEYKVDLPQYNIDPLYVDYFAGVENVRSLFTDKDIEIIEMYYYSKKELKGEALDQVIYKIVMLIEQRTGVTCSHGIKRETFIDSLYTHLT